MDNEASRLLDLRGRFLTAVVAAIPDTAVNGSMDSRIPGNLNLSFAGVQAEDLMVALKDLAISTGSACTSESVEPSYVLKALGLGDEMAHASVRIGFGRFTTGEEVDFAAATLATEVERLRRVNPRQRAALA